MYRSKILIILICFFQIYIFPSILKKHQKEILYYPGGTPKVIQSYYYNKNNEKVLNGKTKTYFSSGQIQSITNYKNNKLSGISKKFYSNQKIKWKGQFKNNLKHGKWLFWDSFGNKKIEGKFKRGNLKYLIHFYQNGHKKRKEIYNNNKQLIKFITWDKAGIKHANKTIPANIKAKDHTNNIFYNFFHKEE